MSDESRQVRRARERQNPDTAAAMDEFISRQQGGSIFSRRNLTLGSAALLVVAALSLKSCFGDSAQSEPDVEIYQAPELPVCVAPEKPILEV